MLCNRACRTHSAIFVTKTSSWKKRTAFSLAELMVVIVIIGLLVGAVTVSTRGYLASGRQGVAKMEIGRIVEALESFSSQMQGKYPDTREGLGVLTESTSKFPDGLLNGNLDDPWGNAYEYVVPGDDGEPYEIICSGADGRIGTEDDISSTDLSE